MSEQSTTLQTFRAYRKPPTNGRALSRPTPATSITSQRSLRLPLREDEMGEMLWRTELVWVLEKMGG